MLLCAVSVIASAQTVPPVDLSRLATSDFTDEELDLPYYLAHFHKLANSVVMSGPNRGYIDLAVWRSEEQQAPYNARIMENILSLAFFYATERAWNPYYGHPAVRERLEAALRYWIGLQSEDGFFSETRPEQWGISPTAFATKFMGETLRLLRSGPPIDNDLQEAVRRADRRALMASLTSDDFFEHGTRYSNHYTTIWAGASAYLLLFPDAELAELLQQRIVEGLEAFQSPAGYFYERRGPDWVYEIETHHSNHLLVWEYVQGGPLEDAYAEAMLRWYNWLGFNAVIEPDTSGFVLNHAIAARRDFPFYVENRVTTFGRTCAPVAERVVMARAFCESVEERDARLAERRAELEDDWPRVPALQVGAFYGYSPYAFLHRSHGRWHPTEEQKGEARRALPYSTPVNYVHQRADSRENFVVSFIRRPAYYATFNTGEMLDEEQRYGIGILWSSAAGAVLQSQRGSGPSWGTTAENAETVYEAQIPNPRFELNGSSVSISTLPTDLPPGTFSVSYDLGTSGEKSVTFLPDEIVVSVQHAGAFSETIPLLVEPGDRLTITNGTVELRSGLSIEFVDEDSASATTLRRRVARKRTATLQLTATGSLVYRIRFDK